MAILVRLPRKSRKNRGYSTSALFPGKSTATAPGTSLIYRHKASMIRPDIPARSTVFLSRLIRRPHLCIVKDLQPFSRISAGLSLSEVIANKKDSHQRPSFRKGRIMKCKRYQARFVKFTRYHYSTVCDEKSAIFLFCCLFPLFLFLYKLLHQFRYFCRLTNPRIFTGCSK